MKKRGKESRRAVRDWLFYSAGCVGSPMAGAQLVSGEICLVDNESSSKEVCCVVC